MIKRRDTIGSEITKTRPGVIVSNNTLNATSEVVEVVYLTTQPKKDVPTHVCINATGVPSMAICEQVDSVSLRLVCGKVGTCSEEEMAAIDKGLLHSLGIHEEKQATQMGKSNEWLEKELEAVKAERDRYVRLLDVLLGVDK